MSLNARPSGLQRIPLPYREDSADYFAVIRDLGNPVWLDSGHPTSAYGRFDIMSAAPAALLCGDSNGHYLLRDGEPLPCNRDVFDALEKLLPVKMNDAPAAEIFSGGLLGYIGYDAGAACEAAINQASSDIDLPWLRVGLYPWAIVQDHVTRTSFCVLNPAIDAAYNFLNITQRLAKSALDRAFHASRNHVNSIKNSLLINDFKADIKVDNYTRSIKRIHDYIDAGDCYQINYAQRFTSRYTGDPLAAFLQLRHDLPSPFSGYMEFDGKAIVSVSPERFVLVEGRTALTQPIKGTIGRDADPARDAAAAEWLLASEKDRAENVMIVDLLRNDFSKVCRDVSVPALCELQSFPNVHHLVSSVTGTLREGVHPAALLKACFPGGSITGAPKIRAMQIIDELEAYARSVYCGSLLALSSCGRMDTNIAIRTLVFDGERAYVWGGGGITRDSQAMSEYQETLAKVGSIMRALERAFGAGRN